MRHHRWNPTLLALWVIRWELSLSTATALKTAILRVWGCVVDGCSFMLYNALNGSRNQILKGGTTMAVEFYTWKCKKCGKDINRDEVATLIEVKDGKEVSRIEGVYAGGGHVWEPLDKVMGKADTAAWHTVCYESASDADKKDLTVSKEGAGDGMGDALPKFKDKTAMLEQATKLVKELFANDTTAAKKKTIIEQIAKLAGVEINTKPKESKPKSEQSTLTQKVSRAKTAVKKAQEEVDKNPSDENKQKLEKAQEKYTALFNEAAEKYPEWAEKQKEKANEDAAKA